MSTFPTVQGRTAQLTEQTSHSKLQHPLGVAWNPLIQRLYVADSYNHKVTNYSEKVFCFLAVRE